MLLAPLLPRSPWEKALRQRREVRFDPTNKHSLVDPEVHYIVLLDAWPIHELFNFSDSKSGFSFAGVKSFFENLLPGNNCHNAVLIF